MNYPAATVAPPRALRLPARGSLFWLAVLPLAALAAAMLAMHLLGVSGGDDPAHLYKIALLRDGQSVIWDNYWYGGSYGTLTYGIVYYWLAQFVPGAILTVVSGGLLPLLFHLYLRDGWGVRRRAPAWTLAAVMVVYLAWGQSPFLLAMCLTMGGLVLLARGHSLLGALPCALGVFTNPLALVAGGIFLLAALIARPEARRGIVVFALAMIPVCALRIALAAVFAAPSWEFHYMAELGGLTIVAVIGVALARRTTTPEHRALQWVFVALLVVVVPAYLLPDSPLGSNAGRFFYLFGGPLLVAVARPSRLPRLVPAAAVAAVLVFQLAFPVWMLANAQSFTATRAAFFSTAVAYAGRVYDPDYRFHIVTPEMHWESYYFPAAGFPITRGWYRQADALHNDELYDRSLDTGAYSSWLRRMGVRYVFLPHAPLVADSRREAAILEGSSEFTVVYRGADWTVYRLASSEPLVVPLGSASASVLAIDHTSISFAVTKPGPYLVKLTWSPYWLVARRPDDPAERGRDGRRDGSWEEQALPNGRALLHEDPYGFMIFSAPAAGVYALRFDLAKTAEAELRQ
ncbi:MAG TPA: hypothetical protein VIL79_01270 [Thermoleophilia bacterium]